MRTSTKTPGPPRHGRIIAGAQGRMTATHVKKHLAELTASAAEVRDYGGHSATGYSSQGAFAQGGATGADYQTTSVGAPDADSALGTGS